MRHMIIAAGPHIGQHMLSDKIERSDPMKSLRILIGLIVCGYLILAIPAHADVVADWNAIATQTALQTVIPPVRPGPTAILDLAMVHAAMHDAIQAFEGRFESYGAPIPNASGSPVAAAARAAHDVLVARFPNQSGTLDKLLDDYLNGLGLPRPGPGHRPSGRRKHSQLAGRRRELPEPPAGLRRRH
jgi:hypothetical protein